MHQPENGRVRGRLLVVDDDQVSLDVISAMLNSAGYQVVRASSRDQALDLLSNLSPGAEHLDAVFVDLLMPGLPGLQFVTEMRALPVQCLRWIAMSATPAGPAAWEGFDHFLLKPVGIESLLAVLGVDPGRKSHPRSHAKESIRHPSTDKEQSSVDRITLGKLSRAMSPGSLQELYRECVQDSRSRIEELRQLVETGRADELRRGAHQVKGAAAMVGATRLAALSASLEMGSYDKENSLGYLDEMVTECDRIERMLLAGLPDH